MCFSSFFFALKFHFPYLCSGIVFVVAFTFALNNRNGLIELGRKGLLTSKGGTHYINICNIEYCRTSIFSSL